MGNPRLESLLEDLRNLFQAEYARGERDTMSRVLQALKGEVIDPSDGDDTDARNFVRRPKPRAPTGASRDLVDGELRRAGAKGVSPKEIYNSAANQGNAVSYAAIRKVLRRGRDDKRYLSKAGRWSLTAKWETLSTPS